MTAATAVTHRHGCTEPGWLGGSPLIAGVTVIRCAECGATAIVRPKERTTPDE